MSKSRFIAILTMFGIFCLAPSYSYAYHQEDVLGDSTTNTNIDFPAVTDGPGFILPDSPFYLLDRVFQRMKLSAAISPEEKVKTRMLLIGERMAETRAMMVRKNIVGTQIALDELRSESERLSYDLRDANGQGKDISDLAKDINDRLKLHRDFLSKVADQSEESLALQLMAANQSLLLTKSTAEDFLADEFLAQAVADDLEDGIDSDVLGVETKASNLQRKFEKLEENASKSAARMLEKQNKEAQKEKNQNENASEKKLSEARKVSLQKLRDEKKVLLNEAKEVSKKAREIAKRIREIRKEEKLLNETQNAAQAK